MQNLTVKTFPCIGPLRLPSSLQDLQKLITGTLAAAGWLILMTIGIVIAEIIAIVLVILNLQSTVNLVFSIIVSFGNYMSLSLVIE